MRVEGCEKGAGGSDENTISEGLEPQNAEVWDRKNNKHNLEHQWEQALSFPEVNAQGWRNKKFSLLFEFRGISKAEQTYQVAERGIGPWRWRQILQTKGLNSIKNKQRLPKV